LYTFAYDRQFAFLRASGDISLCRGLLRRIHEAWHLRQYRWPGRVWSPHALQVFFRTLQ
jgi:hypothetical protein